MKLTLLLCIILTNGLSRVRLEILESLNNHLETELNITVSEF